MTPLEPSEAPPRERTLLSGEVRLGALGAVACLFGLITHTGRAHWPLWVDYPIQLLVALVVGFGFGISQEEPDRKKDEWRSLRWRLVWYQAIGWALTIVLFLSGIDIFERAGGWQIFLVVALLLLVVSFVSERLITRFRCPHCRGFFFHAKKSSKGEENASSLKFGMTHWRNTRCQHCDWPLWKPVEQN